MAPKSDRQILEAAARLHDQAQQDWGILCPNATLSLSYHKTDDHVDVVGQFSGDLDASEADVREHFLGLGLSNLTLVDPVA